jgi:hypothetical protein
VYHKPEGEKDARVKRFHDFIQTEKWDEWFLKISSGNEINNHSVLPAWNNIFGGRLDCKFLQPEIL